jgi:hypothetical protein
MTEASLFCSNPVRKTTLSLTRADVPQQALTQTSFTFATVADLTRYMPEGAVWVAEAIPLNTTCLFTLADLRATCLRGLFSVEKTTTGYA